MRNYPLVMRAYPADYRDRHGAEIVGIAQELSGGRWSIRQASSLFTNGLSTRARLATGGTARSVWAQGIVTVVGFVWLLIAAQMLALTVGVDRDVSLVGVGHRFVLLQSVLTVGLLIAGVRRWSALLIGAGSFALVILSGQEVRQGLAYLSIPVVALLWAVDQESPKRAFSPLVGAALFGIMFGSFGYHLPDGGWLLAAAVLSVVVGLALVAVDPRPFVLVTVWLVQVSSNSAYALLISDWGREGLVVVASSLVALIVAVSISAFGVRRLNRAAF